MTREERVKAINESKYYRSPFNTPELLAKADEASLVALETFIVAEGKKDVDEAGDKQRDKADKLSDRTEHSIRERPKGEQLPAEPEKPAEPVTPVPRQAAAMTADEWLTAAPAEIRDLVERQKATDTKQRADLTSRLKSSSANKFTDAELAAMPMRDLSRIAELANVAIPVDYSGLGLPRVAQSTIDVYSNPPDGYELALKARNNAH